MVHARIVRRSVGDRVDLGPDLLLRIDQREDLAEDRLRRLVRRDGAADGVNGYLREGRPVETLRTLIGHLKVRDGLTDVRREELLAESRCRCSRGLDDLDQEAGTRI